MKIRTVSTKHQNSTHEKLCRPIVRNFALQLTRKVQCESLDYGATFKYGDVCMGKTDVGDYVTVEEFVPGKFIKYITIVTCAMKA